VAALIASQRAEHRIPAAVACRALGVSRSWFCKWKGGTLPLRAQRRQRLAGAVKRLFEAHGGKYGSPRITDDLRDDGWRVSENTVAALMREQGLAARAKKKRGPPPGRAGAGGGHRTWSSGTSPPARSTRNGMATAPKFPPMRASSTLIRSWTWPPAECWGSPSASITTPRSPMVRWPWRPRCAAARCPG
jgi:HTH-like domain